MSRWFLFFWIWRVNFMQISLWIKIVYCIFHIIKRHDITLLHILNSKIKLRLRNWLSLNKLSNPSHFFERVFRKLYSDTGNSMLTVFISCDIAAFILFTILFLLLAKIQTFSFFSKENSFFFHFAQEVPRIFFPCSSYDPPNQSRCKLGAKSVIIPFWIRVSPSLVGRNKGGTWEEELT